MKPVVYYEEANVCLIISYYEQSEKMRGFIVISSERAIRNAQANKKEFKSNGTDRLLLCTDDIDLSGGSIITINKNI